jgi:hypothetical protein
MAVRERAVKRVAAVELREMDFCLARKPRRRVSVQPMHGRPGGALRFEVGTQRGREPVYREMDVGVKREYVESFILSGLLVPNLDMGVRGIFKIFRIALSGLPKCPWK